MVVKWDQQEVIFRQPGRLTIVQRLCLGVMFALPLTALSLVPHILIASVTRARAMPVPDYSVTIAFVICTFGYLFMLLGLLSLCRPRELKVDTEHLTYRYQDWLSLRRVRSGKMSDFMDLCIKYSGGSYSGIYRVVLAWEKPSRLDALLGQPYVVLSSAKQRREAEEQLYALQDKLRWLERYSSQDVQDSVGSQWRHSGRGGSGNC